MPQRLHNLSLLLHLSGPPGCVHVHLRHSGTGPGGPCSFRKLRVSRDFLFLAHMHRFRASKRRRVPKSDNCSLPWSLNQLSNISCASLNWVWVVEVMRVWRSRNLKLGRSRSSHCFMTISRQCMKTSFRCFPNGGMTTTTDRPRPISFSDSRRTKCALLCRIRALHSRTSLIGPSSRVFSPADGSSRSVAPMERATVLNLCGSGNFTIPRSSMASWIQNCSLTEPIRKPTALDISSVSALMSLVRTKARQKVSPTRSMSRAHPYFSSGSGGFGFSGVTLTVDGGRTGVRSDRFTPPSPLPPAAVSAVRALMAPAVENLAECSLIISSFLFFSSSLSDLASALCNCLITLL